MRRYFENNYGKNPFELVLLDNEEVWQFNPTNSSSTFLIDQCALSDVKSAVMSNSDIDLTDED